MSQGLVLVMASANPDKVREIESVLSSASSTLDVALLPRPEGVADVVEDGETLLDNARLKARALVVATGEAAVADDTGLEVEALGGAPGVYSARYAGEDATYADNVAKLLLELDEVAGTRDRRARFRTVALAAFPDGSEVWAEGTVEGSIAVSPRRHERVRVRPRLRGRRLWSAGTDGRSPRCRERRRRRSRIEGGHFEPSRPCWRNECRASRGASERLRTSRRARIRDRAVDCLVSGTRSWMQYVRGTPPRETRPQDEHHDAHAVPCHSGARSDSARASIRRTQTHALRRRM